MQVELNEQLIADTMSASLAKAIGSIFEDHYKSPVRPIIEKSMESAGGDIRRIVSDAIRGAVNDEKFIEQVRGEVRNVLAKELVKQFAKDVRGQVNALKSNPTTRAQIVEALDRIAHPIVDVNTDAKQPTYPT